MFCFEALAQPTIQPYISELKFRVFSITDCTYRMSPRFAVQKNLSSNICSSERKMPFGGLGKSPGPSAPPKAHNFFVQYIDLSPFPSRPITQIGEVCSRGKWRTSLFLRFKRLQFTYAPGSALPR